MNKNPCKLCGVKCFNKLRYAIYCKGCADIAWWLSTAKSNTKTAIKRKFPDKKVTFRLIIDKIENRVEHGN